LQQQGFFFSQINSHNQKARQKQRAFIVIEKKEKF
jgi:hypothetical protein